MMKFHLHLFLYNKMRIISIYLRFFFERLLTFIGLIVILVGGYVFKVNHISFGLLNFICRIFHEDEKKEYWMYQIEYLIFVFVIAFVVTMVLISFYKDHKNRRRKTRKKYIGLFVKSFFSYLYAETALMQIKKKEFLYKLWKGLGNEYARRLYINLLRQIYLETEGEVHDRSIQLFNGLEYDSFIKAYFLSPFLRNNLFALKTVRNFRIEGYEKYIIDLLHRKDKLTRSAALTTLVQFEKYNDLLFLVENQIEISNWQINLIIKSLPISSKDKIQYKVLIASNLTSLSTLGIILANLNGKKEFKKDIKTKIVLDKFMGYSNEEAVSAITSFASDSTDFEFLIGVFGSATEMVQIQILKVLSKCPDKSMAIFFLEQVVENHSYPLKIAAVQSLFDLDMLTLLKFKKSNNPVIRQSCNQVLDLNM